MTRSVSRSYAGEAEHRACHSIRTNCGWFPDAALFGDALPKTHGQIRLAHLFAVDAEQIPRWFVGEFGDESTECRLCTTLVRGIGDHLQQTLTTLLRR